MSNFNLKNIVSISLLACSLSAFGNGFGSVGGVNGQSSSSVGELVPLDELLTPEEAGDVLDANEILPVATQHFTESAQQDIVELTRKMRQRFSTTDPAARQALEEEISSLEESIKSQVTAAELAAAAGFYAELSAVSADQRVEALNTPQDQDPNNLFILYADQTTSAWNQGINLSAVGGMNGTISYHKESGGCVVEVSGLVRSNGVPTSCKVYARRTATAGFFVQSEMLDLEFTPICPTEGQELVASATESSAEVGDSVQITASGGGCGNGVIQYYESQPYCAVSSAGKVTASRASVCSITVTRAPAGTINSAQQATVTVEFVDGQIDGPLLVNAPVSQTSVGERITVTTIGGGTDDSPVTFGTRGTGCQVNSSGEAGAYTDADCEVYANKGGQTASICLRFGAGSANPPVACASPESLQGPLVIATPAGPVSMNLQNEWRSGSYRLAATGGGTGALRFEKVGGTQGCTIAPDGLITATVSSELSGVVCQATARRDGGPEGTVYSTNQVSIAFGEADIDGDGSLVFQPLVISSPAGLTAEAGVSITLEFTGGRTGNPFFGNADLPTGCDITTDGIVTRPDSGLCHVSAFDNPEYSNALCLSFGGAHQDASGTCTEAVPEPEPEASEGIQFAFESDQAAVNEAVSVTLSGLTEGETYSLSGTGGYYCRLSPGGLVVGGGQPIVVELWVALAMQNTCTIDQSCQIWASNYDTGDSVTSAAVGFSRTAETPLPAWCP